MYIFLQKLYLTQQICRIIYLFINKYSYSPLNVFFFNFASFCLFRDFDFFFGVLLNFCDHFKIASWDVVYSVHMEMTLWCVPPEWMPPKKKAMQVCLSYLN